MTKYILIIACFISIVACKKNDITQNNPKPQVQDPKLPLLTTDNISNLTYFSVIFSGKIIDSAALKISELGFVVDTISMPTISKNFIKFLIQKPNSDGTFSINVTYLPSNTTFYIRSYAINSIGTGYGNEIKFSTLLQKIFKGNLNLSTQQQVIDFGANHYTTIDGALNINGSVSDLTPLLGLSVINNGFNVTNSLLVNFKGLDSLEITGAIFPNNFWVEYNKNLVNFTGLSKLKITRGSVQIDNNSSLLNLDGLDNYVAASAGTLRIGECEKLQNLNGLKRLTFIGEDFYIINNPSLNDITGLSNLSTISGRLYIINNPTLQNLNGFEKIQSLPDGVEIDKNSALYDLNGLRNLNSINSSSGIGTITINGNPNITDLSVFNQISTVDYVYIENNGKLNNLSGLKNLQSINYFLHIDNDLSLTDLSGLEKLSSVGRLEVFDNNALLNLKGLSGLTKIINNTYSIYIGRNNNLRSLTGLENLIQADGSIQIYNNSSLTDFCPLKTLFSKGYNHFFSATDNTSNPSQNDIILNCH